jgi:hypothetical protein
MIQRERLSMKTASDIAGSALKSRGEAVWDSQHYDMTLRASGREKAPQSNLGIRISKPAGKDALPLRSAWRGPCPGLAVFLSSR